MNAASGPHGPWLQPILCGTKPGKVPQWVSPGMIPKELAAYAPNMVPASIEKIGELWAQAGKHQRFLVVRATLFPDDPPPRKSVETSIIRNQDWEVLCGDNSNSIAEIDEAEDFSPNSVLWLRPEPHKKPPRCRIITWPKVANEKPYEAEVNIADIVDAVKIIHGGTYGWCGDLRCAFFQVPIPVQARAWYRIRVKILELDLIHHVRMRRLPMGARASPEMMHGTLESIMFDADLYSVKNQVYIDNLLLVGSEDNVRRYLQVIKERLCFCGLQLGEEDGGPAVKFRGIVLDFRNKTIALTEKAREKLNGALSSLSDQFNHGILSVRSLLSAYGILHYYSRTLWFHDTMHSKADYFEVSSEMSRIGSLFTQHIVSLSSLWKLSPHLMRRITDWFQATMAPRAVRIPDFSIQPSAIYLTDASSGYGGAGAILREGTISIWARRWDAAIRRSINALEFRAMTETMERDSAQVQGEPLGWITDNEVAACVLNSRTARSSQMNNELMFFNTIRRRNGQFFVWTKHTSSADNPVDGLSRGLPLKSDDIARLLDIYRTLWSVPPSIHWV